MIILGIHDGHCASACLMVDGELVALAAEERFTRLKNDYGYPKQAIEYCLSSASLSADDIDQVAFATMNLNAFHTKLKSIASFTSDQWLAVHHRYWKPRLYDGIEDRTIFHELAKDTRLSNQDHYYDFSEIDADYDFIRDMEVSRSIRLDGARRHLGTEAADRIVFYDHHACHAYYALFASPIRNDNTLIYTLDGGGDSTTSTLFRYMGGRVEELARSNSVDIGRIYREVTLLLGMKTGEHEFKVMGLAPYATDREARKSYQVFDGMFEVDGDMLLYAPDRRPKDNYFHLTTAFEGHRFDGIAAAAQRMVEDSVQLWFREMQAKYRSRHAVFAGGVAMNVKLNMLLAENPDLEEFYVAPSPTDDTLCVGACYMGEAASGQDAYRHLRPIRNAYVGPEFANGDIQNAILQTGANQKFTVMDDVSVTKVAKFLAEGKVISRCSGRMEFGARALGNRSILASPRDPSTVDKINRQIKYRDFWMPFAPVVIAERANDYLADLVDLDSYAYMMISAKTTDAGKEELGGAIHGSDMTARPQVLARDRNPGYYDIIKAFEGETGTGALLNTSFNLHGEPIVCTPEDAISTFERSDLDVLLMNETAMVRE
ncbi:MAG: carbamoyltransferase [Magnetovibrio sp.]|nr:carbamoyltransferase [Magnetovibrio sp.]|tara:strand:- start:3669 stop:5474 length:1806 start_codon:yes stop_codon:yes gene_type:complete